MIAISVAGKTSKLSTLKGYINLSNSEGIAVEKAFLLGSYSGDKATGEGNIDVMIVSSNYDETNDLVAGKIGSLTRFRLYK